MNPLTRRQLARFSGPEPSLGEALWRRTNEVRMRPPMRGASGRLKDTIYVQRGEKTFVRQYVKPVCPNTPRQLDGQERFRLIQRSWSLLPSGVREAWCDFSRRHVLRDRADDRSSRPGQNAFARSQTYRLGWGGELLAEAPVFLPPSPARFVEEVPAPEGGQMAFRVGHDLKKIAGYRLLFEITPATPTLKRKPEERRFVWAGESTTESFLPLAEDGAVYFLERPRFLVEPGQRYGVRVRLLTPEGLPGPALTGDLIRMEPEEGAAGNKEPMIPQTASRQLLSRECQDGLPECPRKYAEQRGPGPLGPRQCLPQASRAPLTIGRPQVLRSDAGLLAHAGSVRQTLPRSQEPRTFSSACWCANRGGRPCVRDFGSGATPVATRCTYC